MSNIGQPSGVPAHSVDGPLDETVADAMQDREVEQASQSDAKALFGPFDGAWFREIARRKQKGRDAKCIVTAKDGQTGVGKTNFCDFAGYVTDTSAHGFGPGKTTIDPYEFIEFYGNLPEGSACIMEEGEQFDARRSNSNKNVDAAEKLQMARVRLITAYINLPSPKEIDSRFERLTDYWINIQRRGRAKVYKKRIHPIKQTLYYQTLQTIEWPNMDGSASFSHMDAIKNDRLEDGGDSSWVREAEVQERIEKARKETRQKCRNEWLTALNNRSELTARRIAELPPCDVSFSRINQIANQGSK
jgi:hypothetical protein